MGVIGEGWISMLLFGIVCASEGQITPWADSDMMGGDNDRNSGYLKILYALM